LPASLTPADDASLARLAAAGDRAAYGELVRRSLPAVRALVRRMGAQAAVADDIAQDAFIAAFRALATYRAEASFAAWTMRIAARLYVRHCRREARWRGADELVERPVDADAADAVDLDRALLSLSSVERLCVGLCHGAGFSHAEIAVELAMPLGTVKSHVLRGTSKLRKCLGVTSGPAGRESCA
jgi:RNA polymerase sigma-70 factor (ECF subfamily)